MKKIKLIGAISLASIGVIVAGSLPLSSYIQYQNYLAGIDVAGNKSTDSANENDKGSNIVEQNVLVSITAKLKDGVRYFDNYRAEPKKDDFDVVATYQKGSVTEEETIYGDQFEMVVPENFRTEGGVITFSFKGKSAQLAIELVKVALETIKVTKKPYIIYYKEGEKLQIDGIQFQAYNNDGSEAKVDANQIVADEHELVAGQKEGFVALKGNPEVKGSFPITVVSSEDYDQGKIVSVEVTDGDPILKEGQKISEIDFSDTELTAVYSCGNRRPVNPSDLDVSGGDKAVAFGDKVFAYVKDKKGGKNSKLEVQIVKELPLDSNISLIGFEKKSNQTTYMRKNDGSIAESENSDILSATDVAGEKKVVVKFDSAYFIKADMTIDVAFSNPQATSSGYLSSSKVANKEFSLKVNGIFKTIKKDVVTKEVSDPDKNKASMIFQTLNLKEIDLNKGENTLELSLIGEDSGSISLKSLSLGAKGESPLYDFPEYQATKTLVKENSGSIDDIKYTAFNDKKKCTGYNTNVSGEKKLTSLYSSFIDGGYYYTYMGSFDGTQSGFVKYELDSLEPVLYQEVHKWTDGKENWGLLGDITDIDEDRFAFISSTNLSKTQEILFYNKSNLKPTGEKVEVNFDWELNAKGLSYNKSLERFAVYAGNETRFFSNDGTFLYKRGEFSWGTIPSYTDGEGKVLNGDVSGLSGNDDFIIATTYTTNTYKYKMCVIDWEGNELYSMPESEDSCYTFDEKSSTLSWEYWEFGDPKYLPWQNRMNQVIMDGDEAYLVGCKYYTGFFLLKPKFSASFYKRVDTSILGGYVEKASSEKKTPNYTSSLSNNGKQIIFNVPNPNDKTQQLEMKHISSTVECNGEIYASYSSADGKWACIAKLTETNGIFEVEKHSEAVELLETEGNGWFKTNQIFVKDDVIGLVNSWKGTIINFDSETLERSDKGITSFEGINGKINLVSYNPDKKRYAVLLENNDLYVADEDGKALGGPILNVSKPEDTTPADNPPDVLLRQISTDSDYIYFLYGQDGCLHTWINIVDWEGNKIGTASIPLNGKIDANNIRPESFFVKDGSLYVSVRVEFKNDGQYIYKVDLDQSIFDVAA